MKRLLIIFMIILLNSLFASDMIINKTDGTQDVIAIEDIESIEFSSGAVEFPASVLFIGNSYTYANTGMDTCLRDFVSAAHPDWNFSTDDVTMGGATLEMHYNNQNTLDTITEGRWDYVVLQEQSTRPVDNPELMYEYGALLDSVITESGAETALFMTWARAYDPEMIEDLALAYNTLGEQINGMVCPVGRAWQNSLEQNPELVLHLADDSHPNVWGTYLSVCVFYACFFGESPEGVDYVNSPNITNEDREFLQSIAWETVLDYNPWE